MLTLEAASNGDGGLSAMVTIEAPSEFNGDNSAFNSDKAEFIGDARPY